MNYVIVILVSLLHTVYLKENTTAINFDVRVYTSISVNNSSPQIQNYSFTSVSRAGDASVSFSADFDKLWNSAISNVHSPLSLRPEHVSTQSLPLQDLNATSSALGLSISEQKCMNYSTFVPNFATFLIAGGTDTSTVEFPHMASLGYVTADEILWRCGGSLISDQFVLTAAHCLRSQEFGNVSWVRLGEQKLPAQSDAEYPNDYQIIERIAHPQYRPPSTYNDVALVKLKRIVEFTTFVPACLYTNPNIAPDTPITATGWGLTKFAGNASEQLQKVDLDLFSEQECNETYSNMAGTRKLVSGILGDSQVCAGGRTMGKDTCPGDSGGPLQITSFLNGTNIFRIVGVTSFGKTCGVVNIPGVYSKVSYYVPWIESVVWPSE